MDIVDDLRDLNSMHTPKEVSDIGKRAADEIERLREDIKEANARAYVMAQEVTIWQNRATAKALGEKE
jgi:DNA-directed RNA polymerase specialized sigma subunit